MAPHALLCDGIFAAGEACHIGGPWWSFTKTVLAAAAYHDALELNHDAWPPGVMLARSDAERLPAGNLLPQPLLSAMLDRYPVGGPVAGRPWKQPGYGLGLMTGYTTGGALIAACIEMLERP